MQIEPKWYVLRVVSGQEKATKDYFETELERLELANWVTRILIPSEKVYQIQEGKKRIKERSFLPGYILICADLSDNRLLHAIKEIPKTLALGILGARGSGVDQKPEPLTEQEVNVLLQRVDEGSTVTVDPAQPFVTGEAVKIIDGPFSGFSGSIQEIFEERKKLNVIVRIFERNTPIELNYVQVEKVL